MADALGCDVEDIKPNVSLIEGLDAESIDFLDLVFRLERAFKVKIPRGKIVEDARGDLPEAEFEAKGIVTERGMERLRTFLSEVPADRFRTPMPVADIPRLFNSGQIPIDPATGKKYTAQVFFKLPDYDVFAIDADDPLARPVTTYSGVGTTLFNMAVNPVSSDLYVSNTEALNHMRFEGSGTRGTTVRGHYLENRITVIRDGRVEPQDLNPHLDDSGQCDGENERSLSIADPQAMAVSDDGTRLYLAAFGSRKIVRIDTQSLTAGSFMPRTDDQLLLSAGGPTGGQSGPELFPKAIAALACLSRAGGLSWRNRSTRIWTTEGLTRSAARLTAVE